MNEIDLFTHLIDDNEANKILKTFEESTKSASLDYKKMKIKKIFKGQNMKVSSIKGKNKTNPFIFYIHKYENDLLKEFDEKEFFIMLNSKITSKMTDCEKIAVSLIYHSKIFRELIPKIEENLKANKYIFDLGYKFISKEELRNFATKTSIFTSDESINNFLNNIKELLSEEDLDMLNGISMESMNEIDFFQLICDRNNDLALDAAEYKYLLSADLDIKTKRFILMEFMGHLIIKSKNPSKNNSTNINLNNDIEKLKKENERLSQENKRLENEIKKNSFLEEENTKVIENQKIEIENLNMKLETELTKLKEQHESEMKKLNEEADKMNSCFERAFEVESEDFNDLALIYATDIRFANIIYPEVNFIQFSKWKNKKNKELISKTTFVLIQREGISSRDIEEIEQFVDENNISYKIFSAGREKKLIETIAIYKNI